MYSPLEEIFRLAGPALILLPITSAVALKAYDLGPFHGDPADRLITATAIVHGLTLVTRDEKLRAYSGVKTVWD